MRKPTEAARYILETGSLANSGLGDVIRDDGTINWALIRERFHLLSPGERSLVCAAAAIGDGPIGLVHHGEGANGANLGDLLATVDDDHVRIVTRALAILTEPEVPGGVPTPTPGASQLKRARDVLDVMDDTGEKFGGEGYDAIMQTAPLVQAHALVGILEVLVDERAERVAVIPPAPVSEVAQ